MTPVRQDDVDRVAWWHTMQLAPGIVTKGRQGAGTQEVLRRIRLPADLTGKTVLDVGAWDGFFSFEAERRGAKRVLATDSYVWSGAAWGSKDGFRLARSALSSCVEDRDIDVLDLAPERVGTWDVVLCLGVLYHLRHPLLALERLASVTAETLILETHVDCRRDARVPAMVFYPGRELDGDPTNWWGPNAACVEAMLRTAGFANVRAFDDVLPDARDHRGIRALLYRGATGNARLAAFVNRSRRSWSGRTRMAFHARLAPTDRPG